MTNQTTESIRMNGGIQVEGDQEKKQSDLSRELVGRFV